MQSEQINFSLRIIWQILCWGSLLFAFIAFFRTYISPLGMSLHSGLGLSVSSCWWIFGSWRVGQHQTSIIAESHSMMFLSIHWRWMGLHEAWIMMLSCSHADDYNLVNSLKSPIRNFTPTHYEDLITIAFWLVGVFFGLPWNYPRSNWKDNTKLPCRVDIGWSTFASFLLDCNAIWEPFQLKVWL